MTDRDLLHAPTSPAVGFTLVELMVTLAVVAILATLGVPALRGMLQKQQVKADIDSLASSVHLARSEALKRSGAVTICPLASSDAAAPSCDTNVRPQAWAKGWMVFIDYPTAAGALGTYESGTDGILKVEQGSRSAQIFSTANLDSITFQPLGISTSAANTFQIGEPNTYCRKLTLSKTGRASTSDC